MTEQPTDTPFEATAITVLETATEPVIVIHDKEDGQVQLPLSLAVQLSELTADVVDRSFLSLQFAESSNIDGMAYCASRSVVRVLFKNGGSYDYFGVDADKIGEWVSASSVGKFFHAEIRENEQHPWIQVADQ